MNTFPKVTIIVYLVGTILLGWSFLDSYDRRTEALEKQANAALLEAKLMGNQTIHIVCGGRSGKIRDGNVSCESKEKTSTELNLQI